MTNKLQEMRQRLLEQEAKKTGGSASGDNASYAFWNIPQKTTATLRFLPDADVNNPYFWIERLTIQLPFTGTKSQPDRAVKITVPCMQQYGKKCPIQDATQMFWKTENESIARTYYKKRSYLYQGFVVDSPIKEDTVPANPIRRFVLNPKIHEKIASALMNPEIEHMPIDYDAGIDFYLKKTKQGEYDNYDTSEFSRRTRSLSAAERAAIDEHGLFDLKTFLTKEPDAAGVQDIFDMFTASINGELFDDERFKSYRPYNSGTRDAASHATVQAVQHAPVHHAVAPAAFAPAPAATSPQIVSQVVSTQPVVEAAVKKPVNDHTAILAMLQAKQPKKN